MMTKDEALTHFHFHEDGSCYIVQGPRGGLRFHFTEWRRNGKVKTWKREPERFEFPIKHGFYGPHDHITQDTIKHYHLADTCPMFAKLRELTEDGKRGAQYEGWRHYRNEETLLTV